MSTVVSRAEHLAACKAAAAPQLATGDWRGALGTFLSRVARDPASDPGGKIPRLAAMLLLSGLMANAADVQAFMAGYK